ncbi:TRAP transporter small permease subunit [Desulfacinum infernum]|nr:TRAP transporter small permease subunit [Desulfacinum infernum]
MDSLVRFLGRLSDKAAVVSSMAMILVVLLILVEVVARSLFNTSTMVADEYSAYFYVVLVFLGLGFTLKTDGHIRVKALWSRFGGRGRAFLDLAGATVAMGLCLFAIYHAVPMVREAYQLNMVSETPAETPIWIPQLAVPVGLVLFLLQMVAFWLEALGRLLGSDRS